MTEENLSLSITARILPQIEGAAQFEQQLQSLPSRMQDRVSQVISSQGFEQGLADEQIAQAQDWMRYSQGMYAPFQERIDDLLKDFGADLEGGKISKSQMGKYNRKLARLRTDLEDFEPELMDDARDFMSSLDPDRMTMISGALKQARGDISDDIDAIKEKFQALGQAINESNKEGQNFFTELRQAGIFAIGGMVVNEGMKWIRTGAEIEAKERTAFDLSSQVGMYSEQRQYEVFESIRERERLYSSIGMIVGGAIGSAFGPLGILGGGVFGGQIGGSVAGIFNVKEQSEMEEELKFLNQSYGTLGGYVSGAQNYDILRARLKARFGSDSLGSTGLGYTPEQEMGMRTGFSDALGRFDEGKYMEQTTFARAIGVDPNQIYGLNVSGRVTGADYGIGGLDQVRGFTQSIYGQDVSPTRVVEVLNEVKLINEQMLRLNINADARDSLRFAQLPTDLFGADSPYGRLGDLGSTTLKNLEGLMMPRSGAHNAFLFQAMGTDNIMDYTEMMKGGIYSGDNLMKTVEQMKKTTGDDKFLSYFMLNEMMPNAPQGFIPKLVDIITNDEKYKDLIGKLKDQEDQIRSSTMSEEEKEAALKKAKETLLGYTDAANKNISATEKMMEEVSTKQVEAADLWRKTIQDASVQMAEFWLGLGKSERIHADITEKLRIGMDALRTWLGDKGLLPEDQQMLFNKDKDTWEGNRFDSNMPGHQGNPLTSDPNNYDYPSAQVPFGKGMGSDSGWATTAFNNVRNALLKTSGVGSKYGINFLEGFATDGHMPGSAHYSGDAFDFTVMDRDTGKHITKDQYPKELVDTLRKIAEKFGYEYGGDYKTPDSNHFEKSNKPVTIEFHNLTHEDAAKISNMEIVVKPNFGLRF
jgi:hypothetical protein